MTILNLLIVGQHKTKLIAPQYYGIMALNGLDSQLLLIIQTFLLEATITKNGVSGYTHPFIVISTSIL